MRLTGPSFVLAQLALSVHALDPGQIVLSNEDHDSPFNPSFNAFVEQLMADWHTPGIGISVIHENRTWAKGFGYATLPDEPFTPNTLFQGASTTKSFTASLVSLLVDNKYEHGPIGWETPLHDLVGQDFVLKDSYSTTHVSFLDALSHRTGMPRHDGVWYDQNNDVQKQTYLLRHVFPSAQIRTKFQYCNLMYTAVSHVLQSVTGMLQVDLLREWIWEPLGMNQSYYSTQDAAACQKSNSECKLADSYSWDNETGSWEKWPIEASHPPNGAGGVISNVLDYSKWIRALMYESGPLSKAGHAMLKTPRSISETEVAPMTGPEWYGLGLFSGIYRGERMFYHSGGIAGYNSLIAFLPDRKFGFVTIQNSGNAGYNCAGYRLIDQFLGVPENEYTDLNKTNWEKRARNQENFKNVPSKLYPSVPSMPIQLQLPLQNYTGTYNHPGYGNFTINLESPYEVSETDSGVKSAGSAGLPLYATSKYESVLYTFHHVSSEHWLVELRYLVHDARVPDGYTKAKFEIGADGRVEKMGIIAEPAVQGDEAWVWFDRTG